ncbi:MAG TPA: hypothetical protein EYQ50_29100, partial [Verrucomicrobiales bacterium]|nr:hypothetical protein [Verrucomicrobiales bacterium]
MTMNYIIKTSPLGAVEYWIFNGIQKFFQRQPVLKLRMIGWSLMAMICLNQVAVAVGEDIASLQENTGIQTESTLGTVQKEFIFPLQGKHVHSSSIIELADGSLLTCWYHGSGERRANDVVIQGAVKQAGSQSWSDVFLMADTPGLPDCNPVLFTDTKQRIWLFWVIPIGNRWENSVLKYRRADQIGKNGQPQWTWQDSIHLVPGEDFVNEMEVGFRKSDLREGMWAEYALPYSRLLLEAAGNSENRQKGWMPRIHPITLPSGRILLPLYSDGFNASIMAISDDEGETWHPSKPIIGLGPIQPSVVRRKEGQLVAYLRDSGPRPGRVMQSISNDDGESWSVSLDTDIPNPGASIDTIALRDGRWIMALNDTERGRHRLALAGSDDEGRTWKWTLYVDNDPEQQKGF